MAEVILFRGRPGVGKTTLSDRLSARLNLPIIRKDDLYDEIARFNEVHEQRNQISYGILFKMLETNSVMNGRIILDFPFNREEELRKFAHWLSGHHYGLKSILCICSHERTWAERFHERKLNPKPNQLITDFDELKRYYPNLHIEPIENELVVDTTEAVESIIDKICSYLNSSSSYIKGEPKERR